MRVSKNMTWAMRVLHSLTPETLTKVFGAEYTTVKDVVFSFTVEEIFAKVYTFSITTKEDSVWQEQ